MKTNKLAFFMIVALAVAIIFSFAPVAFASPAQSPTQNFTTQGLTDNTTSTAVPSTSGQLDKLTITQSDPNVNGGVPSVNLPNVQIDQAQKFVERKGFEVVGLLQKFVQPFAIAIFIFCAMMSLVGSFGNSQLVGRGILGMIIAILMYAIVLSAPELLDFMNAWLKS